MATSKERATRELPRASKRARPQALNIKKLAAYREDQRSINAEQRTPYSQFLEELMTACERMAVEDEPSQQSQELSSSSDSEPPTVSQAEYLTVTPGTSLSPLHIAWEGRSVPAVRVGNIIMPMRRRTTGTEAPREAPLTRQLNPKKPPILSTEEQHRNAAQEHPQHTNTVHSSTDVVAALYGLSPTHKVFDNMSQVPLIVVGRLGNGSLGVVEEVRTSLYKRSFVRKQVHLPYSNRKERLRIVEQEAAALRFLSHQHIVQLLGTYEEGVETGRHFYSLLMAPVGDNDLRTFLHIVGEKFSRQLHTPGLVAKPTNLKELAWLMKWFQCLASALAYMHRNGFRHQDIKPSNIIHRGPDIFFTDFSSSSAFEIGATTSTEEPARNSIMYAAPEAIKGRQDDHYRRHGLSSDIFSLGCVFMEMLTVLDGRKVQDLHEFCLLQEMATRAQAGAEESWATLLYSRSSRQTERWFDGAKTMTGAMYQACVKPMLEMDRQERPTADMVLESIRARQPWKSLECSCS